ncbi:EF-hand domain-containing protein [Oryzicola mucosus]|uniref:EF-hand domain-containing protein n=1 Tax=Oryzicola mucosus TaxID=2767425 RepID=A0A8J6PPA6_9HYPH|nr:EF-hand domain-containing protein [Oryzicola mucosus]MBD0415882.1 EF-hand domain-containing protein [Oryzicola mucosus]
MKKTSIALAFLALSGAVANAAPQAQTTQAAGKNRFVRVDANASGDITFDEFAAAMNKRWTKADANNDGKVTVAELVETIHRGRAQRIADRMMARFDANKDGSLTKDEIETQQKAIFARLDKNSDGKIVADEMPARKKG